MGDKTTPPGRWRQYNRELGNPPGPRVGNVTRKEPRVHNRQTPDMSWEYWQRPTVVALYTDPHQRNAPKSESLRAVCIIIAARIVAVERAMNTISALRLRIIAFAQAV